jgi:RNA polymerase sigma-70 factor (ECF subfamily)
MQAVNSEDRAYHEALRDLRRVFTDDIEPHRPALFAFCRHLTGDPFVAEDLHQETVLEAFARLTERFEAVRNPRAWLFRIATNTWIDWRRRRGEVPTDAVEDVPADGPPPASLAEIEDAWTR